MKSTCPSCGTKFKHGDSVMLMETDEGVRVNVCNRLRCMIDFAKKKRNQRIKVKDIAERGN